MYRLSPDGEVVGRVHRRRRAGRAVGDGGGRRRQRVGGQLRRAGAGERLHHAARSRTLAGANPRQPPRGDDAGDPISPPTGYTLPVRGRAGAAAQRRAGLPGRHRVLHARSCAPPAARSTRRGTCGWSTTGSRASAPTFRPTRQPRRRRHRHLRGPRHAAPERPDAAVGFGTEARRPFGYAPEHPSAAAVACVLIGCGRHPDGPGAAVDIARNTPSQSRRSSCASRSSSAVPARSATYPSPAARR